MMADYTYIYDQVIRDEREPSQRWEPIPLHLPVPEQEPVTERNEELPDTERGVVIIDFGDE